MPHPVDDAKLSSGLNYGGLVAAPIFSRVAEKAARYLDLGAGARRDGQSSCCVRAKWCYEISTVSESLLKLLDATEVIESNADPQTRIESLCYDSRQAEPRRAVLRLARSTDSMAPSLSRRPLKKERSRSSPMLPYRPARTFLIRVPDARAAMADIATAFYGHPADKLKVMGVTGTNGKTTTAFLVKHLLDADQRRCGLIGTVKYCIGEWRWMLRARLPNRSIFRRLLAQMVDAGNKAVAMEVSSHALVQHRARGIDFDTAVFTNLTQDHLDYHKTMEEYFEAKTALFEGLAAQRKKKGARHHQYRRSLRTSPERALQKKDCR